VTETAVDSAVDRDLPSPGGLLREARESRGRSIEEVAYALKLTPKQVAAIEQDKFDLLPGTTFARGFVRNYARLFQLDVEPLLAMLERRLSQRQVELAPLSNAVGTMPASVGAHGVPRVLLVLLLAVAGALVAAVYFERFQPAALSSWRPGAAGGPVKGAVVSPVAVAPGGRNADPPSPAPVAANTASGEAAPTLASVPEPVTASAPRIELASPAKTASAASTPAPAAGAAEAGVRTLRFGFAIESWVDVKDGTGKMLVSRLNKPGSSLAVTGRPPFTLVVGNARAVRLDYDGKAVDLKPHTAVSIARFKLD